MAMKKPSTTTTAPLLASAPVATSAQTAATPDSGTAAAIGRLKEKTKETGTTTSSGSGKSHQGRDFDEEARGKTRCAQFEAALMSPGIAGMKWDTTDQYLDLCEAAAKRGVAFTFGEKK